MEKIFLVTIEGQKAEMSKEETIAYLKMYHTVLGYDPAIGQWLEDAEVDDSKELVNIYVKRVK